MKVVSGSLLVVKYTCLSGHVNFWQTQSILNGISAGNLLLSAAILISGLTYTKFAHLCEILNIEIMKERTFHTVQSNYLFPVVNRTWDDHQQELYRKYRGQRLEISGDGCCDSPGYSAKYYTGDLEVYHSVLLKYCEKQSHFFHNRMVARTALAALDKNHNIGRQHARTQTGEIRYKVAYPKGRKDWVAKPITEDKLYHYIAEMGTRVVALQCSYTSEPSNHKFTSSQIPANIAPVPCPPKQEVITKHRSRFS